MELNFVRSSAISGVAYDETRWLLRIRFTSGPEIYEFCGVPPHVYEGFIRAPSMGRYYDQHIRDRYQC